MSIEVVYVASPYTGTEQERKQRHREVRTFVAYMLQQGETVISPIVHNHSLAALHNLPKDFAFWQHHCINLLRACDKMYVLMLNGWEESVGVQAEIAEGSEMEIPIICVDPKDYSNQAHYVLPEYRTATDYDVDMDHEKEDHLNTDVYDERVGDYHE